MEHKHDSPQKHVDSHPPRARAGKSPKPRKPLIGALVLLVVTAGFFVYMWHQMSSQLADQRNDNIKLAQEGEVPKTPSHSSRVQRDVRPETASLVAEEEEAERSDAKRKAASIAQRKQQEAPQKSDTKKVQKQDKSDDELKQSVAETDDTEEGESGLLASAVKAVNDAWKALSLFGS